MKLKKYGYLIAIVLMLLIGINNVNAEVNKTCYYMKSDKQALSKLILEDGKANVYINKMGKKNKKASALKDELTKANIKIISSFDSLGLFIIEADDSIATQLMDNDKVDFVLAGGGVPANMKDLNLDGKTDEKDAQLIQQYLTRLVYYSDSDEKEYIKFACDINGDKKINIIDATEIYEKIN